jgi:hypothetical protein
MEAESYDKESPLNGDPVVTLFHKSGEKIITVRQNEKVYIENIHGKTIDVIRGRKLPVSA